MALDIDSVEEQASIENLDDGEDDFAAVLALDIDTLVANNEFENDSVEIGLQKNHFQFIALHGVIPIMFAQCMKHETALPWKSPDKF